MLSRKFIHKMIMKTLVRHRDFRRYCGKTAQGSWEIL